MHPPRNRGRVVHTDCPTLTIYKQFALGLLAIQNPAAAGSNLKRFEEGKPAVVMLKYIGKKEDIILLQNKLENIVGNDVSARLNRKSLQEAITSIQERSTKQTSNK